MGEAQVKPEQMEIVDYVKDHFLEWMEERHVYPFPQKNTAYDPLLLERMVRVEEGIKHQNENLEKMMILSDKRFAEANENMDKRFAEVNETMNRRFAEVNETMNRRFAEMSETMNGRFKFMDKRFNRLYLFLSAAFLAVLTGIITLLVQSL